jgi:formiminoglutamase
MEKLIPFTAHDLAKYTNHRSGEVKFGEKMLTVPKGESIEKFLESATAPYVLLGIPEDIGVRANFGRPGAASAWESAIKAIANTQHNRFCKGDQFMVLGALDVAAEMESVENLDFRNTAHRKIFGEAVTKIDKEVCHIVSTIVKAGKIPVVIGGGHNNAYGNIKGTALAKGRKVNAVNIDAHSDFRILEGRHSGNGFSYAFDEGFLNRYFIFGLHESYTSKAVLKKLKIEENVRFNTYDEIKVRGQKNFTAELNQALEFVKSDCFGVEIDLDAIPGIASSAMTISGFSVEELRQFVTHFASHENAVYLHICEGAPDLAEEKNRHLIGKLIGYLVTDFAKARSEVVTDVKMPVERLTK